MHLLVPPAFGRTFAAFSCTIVCAMLSVPGLHAQTTPAKPETARSEPAFTVEKASELLADVACEMEACMAESRPVLLGERDPSGPSCVKFGGVGDTDGFKVPPLKSSINGGPGMRMGAVFITGARNKTPKEHYQWFQTMMRLVLDDYALDNQAVLPAAVQFSQKAEELARGIDSWTSWPDGLDTVDGKDTNHWPGYCLKSLNVAIIAKDLAGAKRWSRELAATAFWLADLHRWMGFLLENHIAAIEFQAKGQSLFDWANEAHAKDYNPFSDLDQFPGGLLLMHGAHNYLEVERQAEMLFQVPREYVEADKSDLYVTPGSVWMPPRLRTTFLALRSRLSQSNQKTWDLAARTPFEHSYMVNILYRVRESRQIFQLGTVLERFDKFEPQASLSDLMDVLMYRGHFFAGLEWADRYDARLLKAAGNLAGDDEEVLLGAYKFTNSFYGGYKNYQNLLTLRQALDERKLDCTRATDMIGSLFRNAGRGGFYHLRWCAGTDAHTVAAAEVEHDGKRSMRIIDGLVSGLTKTEPWPDAYFNGHQWPEGLQDSPPPYAVDLYGRGLDTYVWLEGYIIRDNNAGLLVKAAVPYLPGREKASSTKVFNGPYPQSPKPPTATTAP